MPPLSPLCLRLLLSPLSDTYLTQHPCGISVMSSDNKPSLSTPSVACAAVYCRWRSSMNTAYSGTLEWCLFRSAPCVGIQQLPSAFRPAGARRRGNPPDRAEPASQQSPAHAVSIERSCPDGYRSTTRRIPPPPPPREVLTRGGHPSHAGRSNIPGRHAG